MIIVGDSLIELIGFFFILILGTLAHFIYEWSGQKKLYAIFFAVNESTWEHIKLAIGPTLLWMLIEIPFIGSNPNFIFAKAVSLLVMILFIPLFFYGYQLITKKDLLYLDILDFILAIALGQYASWTILNMPPTGKLTSFISLNIIIIITIIYLTRTYKPIKNFLFKDPITGKYGVVRKKVKS